MTGHKLTPVLMTGSLLLALLLAVGHHFYYDYLDGKIVENQIQQEWYLRGGTGIAFLARALLSAAVGFAYTQILWQTLRSKSVTIQGINSLFGILHDAWDFTTWELWTAAPALAVVAMIAWALPLIAVVTPATLSVQVSSQPNITTVNELIPKIDYSNPLNFAQWTGQGGVGYNAPSSYVSRVLLSVSSLGSILTIPAPSPNSSYHVDFYGPTISCSTPSNATYANLLAETVKNSTCCGNTVGYVGFAPAFYTQEKSEEYYAVLGLTSALNDSLVSKASSYDRTGKANSAKFYVIVPDRPLSNYYIMVNKSVECQLYNSSFAINFTFSNGQQDISYKTERLNGVSYLNTGISQRGSKDTTQLHASVAYISLMDALGKLLLGSLQISHYGFINPVQTQIMSSVLMDAKEMQIVQQMNAQQYSADGGLQKAESVIGNISMADALEQLFTNVTISLFSNSKFLQNETTASSGPITHLSTQIAFSYEPRNLLIAYGIGLVACATIVIIGLLCIKSASASYGNSFSTILRTTRNPDLDTIVPVAETSGAEPLSKDLGDVRLVLRRQGHKVGGAEEHTATRFVVDAISDKMEETQRQRLNDSFVQGNREQNQAGWI
ncbi:hypothetical protein FBEOM_11180 [Fusarium beomiforme]|uniref:Uncharacterized protein n=1 Tax=Fusarium beomiforme TaxID=44412 RepID=A0A9P5AAE0_9HYPO|nr:hypothetical protein FBEOM_11180 [Fusarium beomiforme]